MKLKIVSKIFYTYIRLYNTCWIFEVLHYPVLRNILPRMTLKSFERKDYTQDKKPNQQKYFKKINHFIYKRQFKSPITTENTQHYIMRNILLTTRRDQHRIYESIMSKFNLPIFYISFHKDLPCKNVQHN